MLRLVALATLFGIVLVGCGRRAGGAADGTAVAKLSGPPPDPMETAREGMHEGAFLLGHAASDLEKSIEVARALQASTKNVDLKAALADVLDKLDDAGSSIADYTGEPPPLPRFKQQFSELDKRRLDSIDGANDALHDIDECNDGLGPYSDKPAPADENAIGDLGDSLDTATGDLTDAIKALGGKVESDDTEIVPNPPTARSDKSKPPLRPEL